MNSDKAPRRSDSGRRLRQAVGFARMLRAPEVIQGRGRYKVKQTDAEPEISERTVIRDLDVLEPAGVRSYHGHEHRYIRICAGFHFPVVNLNDDEFIGRASSTEITSAPGLEVTKVSGPTTRKLRATSREADVKLLAKVEKVTSALDLKLAGHGKHHESIRTIR